MVSAPKTLTDPKRWRLPGTVALLILIFIGVALTTPDQAENVGFVGMILGMGTGSVLFLRRSRTLDRNEQRVWRFFGVAIGLAAAGVAITGVLVEAGFELPAFGALDSFFIVGYLSLITGLVLMARLEGGGRDWLPTILDALVGGVSLAVLFWTILFEDLIDTLSGEGWQAVIAASYPILDVAAIVVLIIMIIRRSNFHFDPRLMFVALGLTAQVVFDVTFLHRGVGESFAAANPPWVLLLLAAFFWVLGASIVDIPPRLREYPEVEAPVWALMWPYLLGGALLTVHVSTYRNVAPAGDANIILDAVLAVGILIFLRQMAAIRRNRRQVEHQRSELVASVSHELRTPLTAMVGYLSLLDDDGDSFPEDARREMIAEATTQAKHMSRLVSDLVMLARGINRDLPLEITEVPLSQIINSALRNTDPESTRIEVEIGSEAFIRVDAVRVQQALLNFLSNAVRYGGDQALLVAEVRGDDLIFEVHDNGEGVPTRHEAKIWERFERGANRLNATNPGLGIGLAIVVAIAQSHGGRADYERSGRLGGACFSLLIPGCVSRRQPASVKVEALA